MNQEQFDFNIQFEQLFLSIIPSALCKSDSYTRTIIAACTNCVSTVFQSLYYRHG
jgi:hypothetical protein